MITPAIACDPERESPSFIPEARRPAPSPSTYNPYRRMAKARRAQVRRRLSMAGPRPWCA